MQSLNLVQMVEQILDGEEKFITDLIREQLSEGKRGDGKGMPKYKRQTLIQKRENGRFISQSGRIALIDEGDFWASLITDASNGILMIDARDYKYDSLIRRYGREITLLSAENCSKLSAKIHPQLKQMVYDHLKG